MDAGVGSNVGICGRITQRGDETGKNVDLRGLGWDTRLLGFRGPG